jgi:hypothetical protein
MAASRSQPVRGLVIYWEMPPEGKRHAVWAFARQAGFDALAVTNTVGGHN